MQTMDITEIRIFLMNSGRCFNAPGYNNEKKRRMRQDELCYLERSFKRPLRSFSGRVFQQPYLFRRRVLVNCMRTAQSLVLTFCYEKQTRPFFRTCRVKFTFTHTVLVRVPSLRPEAGENRFTAFK